MIGSRLTLLASPILMGHVSALLRRANERLLPLLLPYARLAGRERMGWLDRVVFRLMDALGLTRWYWNSQLKRNGAFEHRAFRPHESGSIGIDDASVWPKHGWA